MGRAFDQRNDIGGRFDTDVRAAVAVEPGTMPIFAESDQRAAKETAKRRKHTRIKSRGCAALTRPLQENTIKREYGLYSTYHRQ